MEKSTRRLGTMQLSPYQPYRSNVPGNACTLVREVIRVSLSIGRISVTSNAGKRTTISQTKEKDRSSDCNAKIKQRSFSASTFLPRCVDELDETILLAFPGLPLRRAPISPDIVATYNSISVVSRISRVSGSSLSSSQSS